MIQGEKAWKLLLFCNFITNCSYLLMRLFSQSFIPFQQSIFVFLWVKICQKFQNHFHKFTFWPILPILVPRKIFSSPNLFINLGKEIIRNECFNYSRLGSSSWAWDLVKLRCRHQLSFNSQNLLCQAGPQLPLHLQFVIV